jgi:hypothetical protein
MFGRRPPSGQLQDRIRKIGERAAQSPTLAPATPARSPRQATFRNGAVLYGDGKRLAVVIKDLSDEGARIEFFQRIELPDTVILSEPTARLRRRAIVVWRKEGVAGLRFCAP